MSPELETLDQLQGGELSLVTIRSLYPSDVAFRQGVVGLLRSGDIRLTVDGIEVPEWHWRDIFSISDSEADLAEMKVRITEQGIRKIG